MTPWVRFGVPAPVVFAVRREGMPGWKCRLVGSVRAGLSLAVLVAVMPAVR